MTDSTGSSRTFVYSFTGKTVPGRPLVVYTQGEDLCEGHLYNAGNDIYVWRQHLTLLYLDLVLEVNTSYITVREGDSGGSVEISKTGYSFGEVKFTLRPLTYTEYLSFEDNLDSLYPFRPLTEASCKIIYTMHYCLLIHSCMCRIKPFCALIIA